MSSFNHTADLATNNSGQFLNYTNFIEFFAAQFAVFGPILFFVLLKLLFRPQNKMKKNDWVLAIFAVSFLVIIQCLSLFAKAHANWAAPAYISATILVVSYLIRNNKQKILVYSLVLHCVLGASLMSYTVILNSGAITLTKQNDILKRVRGYREIGAQLKKCQNLYQSAIFVSDNRMQLALLSYYSNPENTGLIKWNPKKNIKDHFDLTTNLNDYVGMDLIVVSEEMNGQNFAKYGESYKFLDYLKFSPYSGLDRSFKLHYIENFKGY